MKFWKTWDEEQRESAVRIAGIFAAVLTIFIFISTVSYLFSWKQDMSLLSVGEAVASDEIGNAAGRLGFRTGHLLVSELFGLGSFALLVIVGAVSVRLLTHRWHYSLMKTCLTAMFGAMMASLLFAYCGHLAGMDSVFGGGLGGRCGAAAVQWGEVQFGTAVSGLIILALIALYGFFASNRFCRYLAGIGKRKAGKVRASENVDKDTSAACDGSVSAEEAEDYHDTDADGSNPDGGLSGKREHAPANSDTSALIPGAETVPSAASCDTNAVPGTEAGHESGNFQPMSPGAPGTSPLPAASGDTGNTAGTAAPSESKFEIIHDDSLNAEVKEELKPIDNRLDPPDGLPNFNFPPSLDMLRSYASSRHEVSSDELTRNNNKIRTTLSNYRIQVVDVKAKVGPTVTLYKVYPAPGVKIADIKKLQEDIAMSLNAKGVRVVTLSDSVGIEVANDHSSIVSLKSLLNDGAFRDSKAELPVAIGYTITQNVKVFDLADAPHLLIAGATKQGKSVCLNVIVSSLLYAKHPSELKFVFIDPKRVEFSAYASLLHHYLAVLPDAGSEEEEEARAIVKQPKDAEKMLRSLCIEMDERYDLLSKSGVNNIKLYNKKYKERHLRPDQGHRYLPYLVVIIDEYADLTMTQGAAPEAKALGRSITNSVIRLAQKGRAAGLHVILATQRPSVDVISGLIKSNFPMRIAFRTASRTDSSTILDTPGAEKLIGNGDMLFSPGLETERIQCGFISGDEIASITASVAGQTGYGRSYGTPYYLPEVSESSGDESSSGAGSIDMRNLDSNFEEAARMVVISQRGSTSDLQRKLGMGYARAGKVMDQLEAAGIVGPQEGSKPRQVLVSDLNSLEPILDAYMHRGEN